MAKKLKIKKSVPFDEMKLSGGDGKLEKAKIKLPDLAEGTSLESDEAEDKGKIIYYKSKKPSAPTLMDARAITDEIGKEMLEKERLKNTVKRYKILKKAK